MSILTTVDSKAKTLEENIIKSKKELDLIYEDLDQLESKEEILAVRSEISQLIEVLSSQLNSLSLWGISLRSEIQLIEKSSKHFKNNTTIIELNEAKQQELNNKVNMNRSYMALFEINNLSKNIELAGIHFLDKVIQVILNYTKLLSETDYIESIQLYKIPEKGFAFIFEGKKINSIHVSKVILSVNNRLRKIRYSDSSKDGSVEILPISISCLIGQIGIMPISVLIDELFEKKQSIDELENQYIKYL